LSASKVAVYAVLAGSLLVAMTKLVAAAVSGRRVDAVPGLIG
jgi:hypothetical protein